MIHKLKIVIGKFLGSPWTITIIATMLGVFAAIFLDRHFTEKTLHADKAKALMEVRNELNDNTVELQAYQEALQKKFDAFNYIFSIVNPDMEIIIPADSIEIFKAKTKGLFDFESTKDLRNGMVKISGDLNFQLESKLMFSPLSDVTWNTYKQTNYLSITRFDCLSDMELIYNIQNEVNKMNDSFTELFFEGKFIADLQIREEFIAVWRNLLMHQQLLIDLYESRVQVIEKCQ